MSRPASPSNSDTSSSATESSIASLTSLFLKQAAGSTPHAVHSNPHLSPQAQDDARRGYVSPYGPIPTAQTMRSEHPTKAIASVQAPSQPTLTASPKTLAQEEAQNAQKQALIKALNERRVNTIGELRRIERIFASLGHPDLTEPMTSAWVYYVNSNSLLTELRGLTRQYPFSSECLDEGKRRVHQDPASNRSWNYCWLVLAKIHTDGLITTYARAQAARPEMWGGLVPLGDSEERLAKAFADEWKAALAQLLRYWETAPIR